MLAVEFGGWLLGALAERMDAALRLVLACALGGWIGLEREASGKPAGFRTNLIICLGAALVTEISLAVTRAANAESGAALVADPGRIAAQVVSGIGFLGAGTIIQSRGSVSGLTTAATLWVVAMIGIGVGAQAYLEVVVATLLVIMALRVLGRVDDHLFTGTGGARTIEVVLGQQPGAVTRTTNALRDLDLRVQQVHVDRQDNRVIATIRASGVRSGETAIADTLLAVPDVRSFEVR